MTSTVNPNILSAKAPWYVLKFLRSPKGGYDVAISPDAEVLIDYAKANFTNYGEFVDGLISKHGFHNKGEYVAIRKDHPEHDTLPPEIEHCESLLIVPVSYVYPLLPKDQARARMDRIESRFETE